MITIGKRRTHEEYVEELACINPNICVIEKYNGVGKHILHKCKICDHEWNATPNNMLHGNQCPKCSLNKRTKTHETFCKEMETINNSIKILSRYQNAKTKVECECKMCGNRWNTSPDSLLQGCGCPKCANTVVSQKLAKDDDYFYSHLPEKIKNNIKIKSKYYRSKEKVDCECLICGYKWSAIPSSLMRGTGCMQCGYKSSKTALTKSNQEFVEELSKINTNIELLEQYTKGTNRIKCRCLICNNIWNPKARNLLQGTSCPNCNGMHKLTHDEFLAKLPEKTINNIEFLTKYVNAKTPIKCRCKICSYTWSTTSSNLYKGCGCKRCAGLVSKTHEEFLNSLSDNILNNIILDGEYKSAKSIINCICKKCGYSWNSTPARLLQGNGCKKCADKQRGLALTSTQEEFINKVKIKNPIVSIIGQYSGSHNKVMCKCKICKHEWEAEASSILCGCGCPVCSASNGERIINYLLSDMDIKFERQKTFYGLLGVNGGLLSYDFYLSEYNLLIEFQGGQHEHPVNIFGGEKQFKIQQEHDKRKREYAKLHNINLLEIWYYDIDNIKSILLQKINEIKNNLKLKSVETTGVA